MRKLDLTNGGISCRIKRQYERGGIPIDIKKTIEDIVAKLKSDEALQQQFLSDPAGALKKLTGIDIPSDQLDSIVAGVRTKLTADNVGGAVKNLGNLQEVKESPR